MKKSLIYVMVCMMLLITKYVVSGGYYDYTLQESQLQKMQDRLIDENKRSIAELENYRSANYLFSQKENLGLQEISPEKTILIKGENTYAQEVLMHNQIANIQESNAKYRESIKRELAYQVKENNKEFHNTPEPNIAASTTMEFDNLSTEVANDIKKSNENNIYSNNASAPTQSINSNISNDNDDNPYRWSINDGN